MASMLLGTRFKDKNNVRRKTQALNRYLIRQGTTLTKLASCLKGRQLHALLQKHQENTLTNEKDEATTKEFEKTRKRSTQGLSRDMCRASTECLQQDAVEPKSDSRMPLIVKFVHETN